MKVFIILLLILPSISLLREPGKWEFVREKDGIKMYSRHSDHSKFNDIKIVTELVGNLSQISAILLDVEKYPQWAYATKTCELIKKISSNELIYYSEIEVPWPASNRDLYAHCKVISDPGSRSVKVISVGIKDYQPEKKNLIRIPLSQGTWNISATSDKTMHLEYILELDPGGAVPAWMLNLFSLKGPMETFANLKQMMKLLNK